MVPNGFQIRVAYVAYNLNLHRQPISTCPSRGRNIMAPIPIIVCDKSPHVLVGVKEGIRPTYEGELLVL